MKRQQQSGIALVITLIMVSVIAFMAVTFLFLSSRERGSVSTASNQTDARLAAESALQRAAAQLLAPIIVSGNPDNYQLLVSTNYIALGYDPAAPDYPLSLVGHNITNVAFNYSNGTALSVNDSIQNLLNLHLDPRPPVYIVTNKQSGGADFRFYVDLNRNGRYDTNGVSPVVVTNGTSTNENFVNANTGALIPTTTLPWDPLAAKTLHVGDPEWIGVLERPELPHSSSNKFIARYAYIALPTGKALDANFIHNEAATRDLDWKIANEGFLRNQGVGSWELNLAAFLRDLNTNYWAYSYNQTNGAANTGTAFTDAQTIISNRYAGLYNDSTKTIPALFPTGNGVNAFNNDRIDRFSDGPLMTTVTTNVSDFASVAAKFRWAGADNPNRYFNAQEFFTMTSADFSNRLWRAGSANSSYDRYTYYRLLNELGTDSAPESGKMNLNYDNLTPTNGVASATNYMAWANLVFFTNAADRLLRAYYSNSISITNIPLYPTNLYTPGVHRLLQLAANLYDATTNNSHLNLTNVFPTVFRPIFARTNIGGTNVSVYIAGYTNVEDAAPILATNLFVYDLNNHDPNDPQSIRNIDVSTNSDVYGVPYIVAARRGFPNFNECVFQNAFGIARKLEFVNPTLHSPPTYMNQLYCLTNYSSYGVEFWNSYSKVYPRNLRLVVFLETTFVLTSSNNNQLSVVFSNRAGGLRIATNYPANTWDGFPTNEVSLEVSAKSFRVPVSGGTVMLTTNFGIIQSGSLGAFPRLASGTNGSQLSSSETIPRWYESSNFRFRAVIADGNRVVDYVSLSEWGTNIDVLAALTNGNSGSFIRGAGSPFKAGDFWLNTVSTALGVSNQIQACQTYGLTDQNQWDDRTPELKLAKTDSITKFNQNYGLPGLGGTISSSGGRDTAFQAPFCPGRVIYHSLVWRANDPLVHYMAEDLTPSKLSTADQPVVNGINEVPQYKNTFVSPTLDVNKLVAGNVTNNLYQVNGTYRPWGIKAGGLYAVDLAYKDSLMTRSDDWDFPTNKLPSIGWMGRVHRGTPWQTVYFKSSIAPLTDNNKDNPAWTNWLGNFGTNLFTTNISSAAISKAQQRGWNVFHIANGGDSTNLDAKFTHPTNDWSLLDLFTTAPNDNATRGRLNVNQTNLASWSAVLSGVLTIDSNNNSVVVEPAGANTNSYLNNIVNGINRTRANTNITGPGGTFTSLGGLLATPELTVSSPFLGGSNNITSADNTTMNDEVVERIPQQIMSLLRGGEQPRFVIYAYGQSLKPADRSIISSGLCTNYQITAETAIRAVVTVTNEAGNYRTIVESYNPLPPD